jgi:hypothetical protein
MQVTPQAIMTVGGVLGAAGAIAATVHAVHVENDAGHAADAAWAAGRPGRQPEIDRANQWVDSVAARFDPKAVVHDQGGLHTVSIYDPTGAAAKFVTQHARDMPREVSTNVGGWESGYDGTYVKLQVSEPQRPMVRDGSRVVSEAMLGAVGLGIVGGIAAALTHGAARTATLSLATAGGAAFAATMIGDAFLPESAIQW